MAAVRKKPTGPHPLTPREDEIIALFAEGEIGKTIGDRLGISRRTVETHIANARVALGAKTIAHAVALWERSRADADRVEYLGLGGIEYLGPYDVDVEFHHIERSPVP